MRRTPLVSAGMPACYCPEGRRQDRALQMPRGEQRRPNGFHSRPRHTDTQICRGGPKRLLSSRNRERVSRLPGFAFFGFEHCFSGLRFQVHRQLAVDLAVRNLLQDKWFRPKRRSTATATQGAVRHAPTNYHAPGPLPRFLRDSNGLLDRDNQESDSERLRFALAHTPRKRPPAS